MISNSLGVELLDHYVVGKENIYSFALSEEEAIHMNLNKDYYTSLKRKADFEELLVKEVVNFQMYEYDTPYETALESVQEEVETGEISLAYTTLGDNEELEINTTLNLKEGTLEKEVTGYEIVEKEVINFENNEEILSFSKSMNYDDLVFLDKLDQGELIKKDKNIELLHWAEKSGLKHSSTDYFDELTSHVFVYEDNLIDVNVQFEENHYELLVSKEIDNFEPYLEAESNSLEGLDPYINEIKYGKTLTKNNDKGLEV